MVMLGGNYLGANLLNNGDVVEFITGGQWVESNYKWPDGNPKMDLICKVRLRSTEYDMRINVTNQRSLKNHWGVNTDNWVGKKATVTIKDSFVNGKDIKVVLLSADK